MRKKSPKHQSDTWVRESISCLCVWICGGTQRHTPVQANQEVRAGFDIDECHPLLSVLSVLEAQRKLSTAFLFSRKNLISIQHASPAHCIQSRALTIQSEHLWLCVCVCKVCVWWWETGIDRQGESLCAACECPRSCMNTSETGTKRK